MSKIKKLKPIRFSDTFNSAEKNLAAGVVQKSAKIRGDYQEHGRSYYAVECGFCLGHFDAYKWSLRGGGKRCPHCSAIMGSSFDMYQWAALVPNQTEKKQG